jgi:predicted nucleotide-binding protein
VFLFMADDKVTSIRKQQLAPRDNVVYEAGYFASAKGRPYTTIIREKGAKVPSDLGGILLLELENRSDLSPIANKLRNQLIDAHKGRL